MSNTMNFGPEWMRRFPAKPDLTPKASSPPPASRPLPAPAHSYSSVAANNVRSQNGGESGNPAFENDFGSSGFMYSKEMMISLYRPSPMPIEFEKYDIMTSEDSLLPMSSQPLTEQEIKILSGSVNSEIARRPPQPEGQQERTSGQRRESFSGEHSSARYDRSDKSSGGARNHDTRSHGARTRPSNLTTEGRNHSFRRSEPVEREREREQVEDETLWNSPVGNSVGSFDANGVFRITNEGVDLQPLSELEESVPESTEAAWDDSLADKESVQHVGETNAGLSLQDLDHQTSAGEPLSSPDQLRREAELTGDNFHFSNQSLGATSNPALEASRFSFASEQLSDPEPAFGSAPIEASKWLYRDPSGSIQGPFSSDEMHEWYKGGFFSPDLMVKREQDPTFEQLGSMIRRIGSDDKPFLLAGIVRAEPPQAPSSLLRQGVPSLAAGRQPVSQGLGSSWAAGLSAPSTPSTPSFGADRLYSQQRPLQQQHSSGDLFSSTNVGQQRASNQDAGYESNWGANQFGRTAEVASGWGGDAFSRSPMTSMSAAHTPLGGPQFMDHQRLHAQELERQQYMQLLQRQSQMQAILHQQQFMAAQQQFGNDPHALAALHAQQQAQQRQIQLRFQQLQFAALHNQGPSTPGGTAMPWGALGQPTSPWTTSIIPGASDNYFDFNKVDSQAAPHTMQQQQYMQMPQHQQPIPQQQQQQHQHVQQHQQQHQQQDIPSNHKESHSEDSFHAAQQSTNAVTQQMETLHMNATVENEAPEEQVEPTHEQKMVALEESAEAAHVDIKDQIEEEEAEQVVPEEQQQQQQKEHVQDVPTQEEEEEVEPEVQEEVEDEANRSSEQEDQDSVEENMSETASTKAPESRSSIKASPAPWAKPVSAEEDAQERRGPTLREIQEMEAKKAEEAKAERMAMMAATAASGSGVLDFAKGLPGAPAWNNSATAVPKKKTLKEIQQEEEAALKRARAAARQASATQAPLSGSGTGLAAIVTTTSGAAGKRYADTIGPKPVASVSAGPWGSTSTISAAASRPATISRSSSVFSSNPALSSGASASRSSDSGWTEVESKRSGQPSAAPAMISSAPVSARPVHKPATSTNSNDPRPPSEDFMRWCRQALKGLQGVVLEDFIQMLLTFPLNPDPMTVEIIQDSIYANSQSLDGRRFADEFIKRRKADAYPHGSAPSSSSSAAASTASAGGASPGADFSFKVVSKKGKKKGTA